MQFDHQAIADADPHEKADRALEVVRELHKRYEAQDQRWHNYSKLIGFICFAGLLLAVLYLQRDAHGLYQVHSTIAASVLPEDITSPSDVLDWLQGFLQVCACLIVLISEEQRPSDLQETFDRYMMYITLPAENLG